MALRKPGRLAIHRRSDEISFLQNRLRSLGDAQVSHEGRGAQARLLETSAGQDRTPINTATPRRNLELEALLRERDLADELLHTRQIEPLGETLQRRLAMAERICHNLALRATVAPQQTSDSGYSWEAGNRVVVENDQAVPKVELDAAENQDRLPEAYWVAEVERRALAEMLDQWWAWLRES